MQKSLYGLKQTTKQSNARFDKFIKAQDFSWIVFDPCVNIIKMNNKIFNLTILLLDVNDMLIVVKNQFDFDICQN